MKSPLPTPLEQKVTKATIATERVMCSVCHQWFTRDINREGGRLVSCPEHSFGEVEQEDL